MSNQSQAQGQTKQNDQAVQIDLRVLWMVFKRFWALILAVAIACGIVSYAYTSLLVTPIYQATATMLVNSSETSTTNITTTQLDSSTQLVGVYEQIFLSDAVLNPVIENLSLSLTTKQVASMISCSSVNETQVMQVSVKNADPALALEILTELVDVAPPIVMEYLDASTAKLITAPSVSSSPVSPNVTRNVAVAAFAGAVVCFLIVAAQALFSNTVKTESDVSSKLGLPVLGVIPSAEATAKASSRAAKSNKTKSKESDKA